MENNKGADREPKHMVLNGAISGLRCSVDLLEKLLWTLTPPRPEEVKEVSPIAQVEAVPVFQEVYDNAPHEINGQASRLEQIIAELRDVLP